MAVVEFPTRLSDRIVISLRRAGKTQTDLAAFIGVESSTVSRWCNGKVVPPIPKLYAIADFTGEEKILDLRDRPSGWMDEAAA